MKKKAVSHTKTLYFKVLLDQQVSEIAFIGVFSKDTLPVAK